MKALEDGARRAEIERLETPYAATDGTYYELQWLDWYYCFFDEKTLRLFIGLIKAKVITVDDIDSFQRTQMTRLDVTKKRIVSL